MIVRLLICSSLFVFASVCARSSKSATLTFRNVTIRGYSLFTYKFNVTIASSNNLKDHLPKTAFDRIDIVDQDVPVLYKNSIADIDDLDELIIESSNIYEIKPETFKNVPQLRKVVIKNNKLEKIEEGVFGNLQIATLDLSSNHISDIASGAFDNMPELLNINLADNKLSNWDTNWFKNTPLLTRVSLQHNDIENIPSHAFRNFRGVKQFGSVPLTINIILSYNKISKIHKDAFKDLEKINNLWLDNNEIESWEEELLNNIDVKELRLNNNKLTCLSGDLGKILVSKTTYIDGNPWDCGCLKNIGVWASQNGRDIQTFYSNLKCDADRIEKKLRSLETLLKELKKNETDASK